MRRDAEYVQSSLDELLRVNVVPVASRHVHTAKEGHDRPLESWLAHPDPADVDARLRTPRRARSTARATAAAARAAERGRREHGRQILRTSEEVTACDAERLQAWYVPEHLEARDRL